MSDMGQVEEARRRAQYYANQSEALKRRIEGQVPTSVRVEPVLRLPTLSAPPYWSQERSTRMQRNRKHSVSIYDPAITPMQIVKAVCLVARITHGDLLGAQRRASISRPRQVAVYLVSRYCGLSLPQLAYVFGQHHTSILYSVRIVRERIEAGNAKTQSLVADIEAQLQGAHV